MSTFDHTHPFNPGYSLHPIAQNFLHQHNKHNLRASLVALDAIFYTKVCLLDMYFYINRYLPKTYKPSRQVQCIDQYQDEDSNPVNDFDHSGYL